MAHLNMGLVLAQLGRKHEAIEAYKLCASLDGTGLKDPKTHETTKISALFNLGRIYADDGQYHSAINIYNDAIAKMPNYYQAQSLYNMMGEVYFKLGQLESQRTESHDHLSAVLGDSGRLYVSPEVIPIYREALPLDTIITPNWFEVE